MLDPNQPIAIYAEATMGLINAKMAEGIIRYGRNPVVAVIDSKAAGRSVGELCRMESNVPIVATLEEAILKGAEVLVLGTAPSGGKLPPEWMPVLSAAIKSNLSIVNGLHDSLNAVFGGQLKAGQWIWDIRIPAGEPPPIATARAAALPNTRVLMVGTDMAVGKMTAGLEIYKCFRAANASAAFLATGQIGISIMGSGIPLDACRVDHASGMVERMVMEAAGKDIVIIEGQGSLLHPGSTATLPLMRGSCCNAMILCHRAGMKELDAPGNIAIPPLRTVIELNEKTASANGVLTESKVIGIALNTRDLDEETAHREIARTKEETGLPVTDTVRFGAEILAWQIRKHACIHSN